MDTANGFGYNFVREECAERRSRRLQGLGANQANEVLPRTKKRKTASIKTKAEPRKNRPYKNVEMSLDCCTERTCLLNFGRGIITLICKDFDSKLYDEQNYYLNSLIDVEPKTMRNRITYNIRDLTGLRKVVVCKKAFLKIFGIGKRRISVLLKKIQPYSGDIQRDQRPLNRNQKKLSLVLKAEVVEHIRSYPREVSHYAREKTRDKQFLAPNLTVAQLWRDFLTKKEIQVGDDLPLCYNSFRKIFRSFNLSFKIPYVDTCGKCDSLDIIAKFSKDEAEKASAREVKAEHIEQAGEHYDCIHFDLNILPKSKNKENGRPWTLPPTWQ